MKVGLSGIITPSEWSYQETLQKAKDAGYEAFELTFREDRDTSLGSMTDQKIADMVKMAEDMGIPFLGSIPLEPAIVAGGDSGTPFHNLEGEAAPARASFSRIVQTITGGSNQ